MRVAFLPRRCFVRRQVAFDRVALSCAISMLCAVPAAEGDDLVGSVEPEREPMGFVHVPMEGQRPLRFRGENGERPVGTDLSCEVEDDGIEPTTSTLPA